MDFGVVLNRIDITSLLQQADHKDACWEKSTLSTASTQHKFPMSENSTVYAQHIKIHDQPLDHATLQNSRQLPHTDVPTAVFFGSCPTWACNKRCNAWRQLDEEEHASMLALKRITSWSESTATPTA